MSCNSGALLNVDIITCNVQSDNFCRFASDKVNFGLNTDDPGIVKTTLNKEFVSAQTDISLTEEQIIGSIYNSARSSFLPENEKQELIKEIDKQIELYRNSRV